jgi:acyl carrier protein
MSCEPASRDEVLGVVQAALAELAPADVAFAGSDILPELSIFEDLGLDSLTMVDLTFLLEEKLSVAEFPIQEWADAEASRDGQRYTVASLVDRCCVVLGELGRLDE